jgi:hypothetical protein
MQRRRNEGNGGGKKAKAARLRDEEGQKQVTPCHGHGTTALRLGRETVLAAAMAAGSDKEGSMAAVVPYTVKKGLPVFPSPDGMSLIKLSKPTEFNYSRPGRVW